MLECPIACVELSRLSRSVADTANLIDSNQEFIFTRAGRAMSKEMVLFASLLGQMESEAISRRVSAGIQNLFNENPEARKTWGGGSRPAAAVKAMNGARIKKADSFALQYGEMILTLRDNGMTLKNVCEMLHRMEIRTARGSLKWNPSQVRNLIMRYQNLTASTHY